MLPGPGGELVSPAVTDSYDLVYGHWPQEYDEIVLVVNRFNEVLMTRLYALGLLPSREYGEKIDALRRGEAFENEAASWSYEELCGKDYYLIPECDYYVQGADGTWSRIEGSNLEVTVMTGEAQKLRISGIVRRNDDDDFGVQINGSIGYTRALTDHIMEYTKESGVVAAQEASPEVNVLTGYAFSAATKEEKLQEASSYLSAMSEREKADMIREYIGSSSGASGMNAGTGSGAGSDPSDPSQEPETQEGAESAGTPGNGSTQGGLIGNLMGLFGRGSQNAQENGQENDGEAGNASGTAAGSASAMMGMLSGMSDERLASIFDMYVLQNPDENMLLQFYDRYIGGGSYDTNLAAFGLANEDTPSAINIYVDSFENKDAVTGCIKDYNETADPEDQIIYTDYVGLLMSSVTTIINVISYVLIAFVSVSLVVSSIMIGIITYISVLERTKEIGILRAIGASKRNISQVFNAETFIVGLLAGLIGVGVTWLLLIPANAVIRHIAEGQDVRAVLPWQAAIILVILSMVLTIIAGFIPSKKAARKDPVAALRTE